MKYILTLNYGPNFESTMLEVIKMTFLRHCSQLFQYSRLLLIHLEEACLLSLKFVLSFLVFSAIVMCTTR